MGVEQFRHFNLDKWQLQTAGIATLAVYVERGTPNVPFRFVEATAAGYYRDNIYFDFSPAPAPASVYARPEVCPE